MQKQNYHNHTYAYTYNKVHLIPLSAVTALLMLAVFFPTPAYAHGSMERPLSRVYNCFVDSGDGMESDACIAAAEASGVNRFNNWAGINLLPDGDHQAFVPDGELCSAGEEGYEGLDLVRDDWEAQPLIPDENGYYEFMYIAAVPHDTRYFQFYITKDEYDSSQPLKWSDLEDEPFCTVTEVELEASRYRMTCPIPENKTGKHVIYNIWQRFGAEAFYACIDVDMDATGPTPTPVVTPTPIPPTPTPVPDDGSTYCPTTYEITGDGLSGFGANVHITNNTGADLHDWQAEWTFTGSQQITSMWNATYVQTGKDVVMTGDRLINAGDTRTIGMRGSFTGFHNPPANLRITHPACLSDGSTPGPTSTPVPTSTPSPTPSPTSTTAPTETPSPTLAPTETAIPTETPTSTPEPVETPDFGGDMLYVSSTSGGVLDDGRFKDEDVLVYDPANDTWAMLFDGSDVGVAGTDVDAFAIVDNSTILLSFQSAFNMSDAGLGTVDDSDILAFTGTWGPDTSGTWSMYFDGSDVDLSTGAEDVDAVALLDNGDLLISTLGNPSVAGLSGLQDEDILRFTPTSLGDTTAGTWSYYFDGSDVGLNNAGDEDIWGMSAESIDSDLYLTTRGSFEATSDNGTITGERTDIFLCVPGTFSDNTACNLSSFWDGASADFGTERLDAITIGDNILSQTVMAAMIDGRGLMGLDAEPMTEADMVEDRIDNEAEVAIFMPIINR
ncbi:MAG: lytic polysaccharide monooxygenase [Chloroflexota bacterium]